MGEQLHTVLHVIQWHREEEEEEEQKPKQQPLTDDLDFTICSEAKVRYLPKYSFSLPLSLLFVELRGETCSSWVLYLVNYLSTTSQEKTSQNV